MLDLATRIRVQVLDTIPGVVLTRVTDALRARGLEVEVRGDDFCPATACIDPPAVWKCLPRRDDATWLFLTSRPLSSETDGGAPGASAQDTDVTCFAEFDGRAAIVSLGQLDSTDVSSSARRVANEVIDGPLHALCG